MKKESLPLNHVANSVRKGVTVGGYAQFESSKIGKDRSEYKFSSYEEKKALLDLLKKGTNYKKDEDLKEYKRNRWKEIQDYASNHNVPIEDIKDTFYSMELPPINEVNVLIDQYKATLPQNIDWDNFHNDDTQEEVGKIIASFKKIVLPKLEEIMNNEKIPLGMRKEYIVPILKDKSPFCLRLNGGYIMNVRGRFVHMLESLKLVEGEDFERLRRGEGNDREEKYSFEKDGEGYFEW